VVHGGTGYKLWCIGTDTDTGTDAGIGTDTDTRVLHT